jgi:hypothetical protein
MSSGPTPSGSSTRSFRATASQGPRHQGRPAALRGREAELRRQRRRGPGGARPHARRRRAPRHGSRADRARLPRVRRRALRQRARACAQPVAGHLGDQEWAQARGIFVAIVPNVVSLKGFFVRLTPQFVHRWFYLRICGADADTRPAAAVHSMSLRPSSLRSLAPSQGWQLEYFQTYEGRCRSRCGSGSESSAGVGSSSSE